MTENMKSTHRGQAARSRVFAVTELLEDILLYLEPTDLEPFDLIKARNVCKQWRAVCDGSIHIRRALWLEPHPNRCEHDRSPFIGKPEIALSSREDDQRGISAIYFSMDDIVRLDAFCALPQASIVRQSLLWQPRPEMTGDGMLRLLLIAPYNRPLAIEETGHGPNRVPRFYGYNSVRKELKLQSVHGRLTVDQLVSSPAWPYFLNQARYARRGDHQRWKTFARHRLGLKPDDALPPLELALQNPAIRDEEKDDREGRQIGRAVVRDKQRPSKALSQSQRKCQCREQRHAPTTGEQN